MAADSSAERSPTETLITCLEDFGADEPKDVIVIYTTKSGDIAWSSSVSNFSIKLGLLEFCKACILKKALEQ